MVRNESMLWMWERPFLLAIFKDRGEDCSGVGEDGGNSVMKIQYEDREILVVYKEAGLAVQTARTSRKDLVSMLKNYLSQPYLGIVHRLDQPVEGLLVFAKTPQSAAKLSEQAAGKDKKGEQAAGKGKKGEQAVGKGKLDKQTAGKGGMEKIYQAAVCLDPVSYPLAVEGMKKEVFLEDCLGRDRSTNMAYVAAPGEQGAKLARLSFHTIWIRDSRALLEIRLYTGRHHQIRVQMAHASMPLAGDRKYGRGEEELPLCLCAARLAFLHPVTGRKMVFCVTPSWLPLV